MVDEERSSYKKGHSFAAGIKIAHPEGKETRNGGENGKQNSTERTYGRVQASSYDIHSGIRIKRSDYARSDKLDVNYQYSSLNPQWRG